MCVYRNLWGHGHGHLQPGGTQVCTYGTVRRRLGVHGVHVCAGWCALHTEERAQEGLHTRVCIRQQACGSACAQRHAHTQDGADMGVRTEGTRSTQLPSERAPARAAQAENSKYLMKAPHSHETPEGCLRAGTACSRSRSQEASLNLAVQGLPRGTHVCVVASW